MVSTLVFSSSTPAPNGVDHTFDRHSVDNMLKGLSRTVGRLAVARALEKIPPNTPINADRVAVETGMPLAAVKRIFHEIGRQNPHTLSVRKEGEFWLYRTPGVVETRPIATTTPFDPPPAVEEKPTPKEEKVTPKPFKQGHKTGLIEFARLFIKEKGPGVKFLKEEFCKLYPDASPKSVDNTFVILTRSGELVGEREGRHKYWYWAPLPEGERRPAAFRPKLSGPTADTIRKYLEDWPIGESRTAERVRKDLLKLTGATEATIREYVRQLGTATKLIVNTSTRPGDKGMYYRQDINRPAPAPVETPKGEDTFIAEPEPAEETEPVTTPTESDLNSPSAQAMLRSTSRSMADEPLAIPRDGRWVQLPENAEIAEDIIELRDGRKITTKWIQLPEAA